MPKHSFIFTYSSLHRKAKKQQGHLDQTQVLLIPQLLPIYLHEIEHFRQKIITDLSKFMFYKGHIMKIKV